MPGYRVLVRNVGIRGKKKIADRWEKEVYIVQEQSNPRIHVFIVKREHGRGARRRLHRNLLLPFMALPATSPGVLDSNVSNDVSSQPSLGETITVSVFQNAMNLTEVLQNLRQVRQQLLMTNQKL